MEATLSIVIPIYNEVTSLKALLQQVIDVEIGMKKELILVDDFSTDGTRDILKEIEGIQEDPDAIRSYLATTDTRTNENAENSDPIAIKVFYHDVNRGKGATLRTGFQHITGEVTIIQDADLEYDPQDYPKLLEPILNGEADVVYGLSIYGRQADRIIAELCRESGSHNACKHR